jgi:hypothetical protein
MDRLNVRNILRRKKNTNWKKITTIVFYAQGIGRRLLFISFSLVLSVGSAGGILTSTGTLASTFTL